MKTCKKCGEEKPTTEFNKCAGKRDGLQSNCRDCCNKATAAWMAANTERHKATRDAWRAANADRVKAVNDAWYAANRDKKLAQNAAWASANRGRRAEKNAEWHAKNRERRNLRKAEHKKDHPELARVYAQNRRARKRESGGQLSAGLSAKLFKLQRGKCACCGNPLGDDYQMDHIIPIALGGMNTDNNIQLLRATCNRQKHAKHPVDFMRQRGFLL